MIDAVRLSRATYELAERGIEALEQIARELKRYNDLHERDTSTEDDS